MSTIDWAIELYDSWRLACNKTAPFKRNDYHQNLLAGKHTLKDGAGSFNFESEQDLFCLHYEALVSSELSGSKALLKHGATRRCDYALFSMERIKALCLLVDITSSTAPTTKVLDQQADKHTGLTKSEKIPLQLLHTLRALYLSPSLASYVSACQEQSHRIAVFAYTLGVGRDIRDAFNRPLKTETKYQAKAYPHPELNKEGFSYLRVESPTILSIPL